MKFTSRSQAGQDKFAYIVTGGLRHGTFLDIGANNPVTINNTMALEEIGWRGLLVDNSAESMVACEKARKSHFYFTDAAQPQNWQAALAQAELPTDRIDYLSLDVDGASLACLSNLPLALVRFRVITLEHDEYARPGTRDAMLDILRHHKYDVLCADVCDQGMSFEIWATDPLMVNHEAALKFYRNRPTEWGEFFQ